MAFHIVRDPLPTRAKTRELLIDAGAGDSTYTDYDSQITDRAVQWIADNATRNDARPWVLMVSLVAPHPPYLAPSTFHRR